MGLEIVVKMDCEGSEFPIFEDLEVRGLIGKIRIFMIEWHKWWSHDKTGFDLVRPLLANGFDILDQTNVANPHAGMIYAIRIGGGHSIENLKIHKAAARILRGSSRARP